MEVIGVCVGEAKVSSVTFVSDKMPKIGEYVVLEYDNHKVLGMVENVVRGNLSLPENIPDPNTVSKILELEGLKGYIKGKIKIIGDVNTLRIPRVPPSPGTKVYKADKETLEKIFGSSGIKIGKLITQPDVSVYLDPNKMVSRHLAILSITGAGKSNTVAVITDELLKHNGTVLIFDMHSEYVDLHFKNGEKNIIPTKINPLKFSLREIGTLANIGKEAYVQFRYLKKAWNRAIEKIKGLEIPLTIDDFFGAVEKELEIMAKTNEINDDRSIYRVLAKIEDFVERFKDMIDFRFNDFVEQIKPGYVNIIDLGSVDEETADVIVSHCLKKILEQRKSFRKNNSGLKVPVFVILEEAHILAPRDRNTLSNYWIARIAREGRKFGIGLCLVSQRPKALSSDALSQANNMIILKLVEPNDQKYVQQSSELLSDELLAHLPSLNTGEAIIIGPMIKIPALVKIDLFEGKIVGKDPDVIKEWEEYARKEKQELEDLDAFADI